MCAKSGEMVSECKRFPPKSYYFLAHLQCTLKFAFKFITWYLHFGDKLTSKKYAKTINFLCAFNEVLKYQDQGGGLTPQTPLRTPLQERDRNLGHETKRKQPATIDIPHSAFIRLHYHYIR